MAVPVDQLTKDGEEIMIRTTWLLSDSDECWSGYDMHFGVNVLAHHHLTVLLLPALIAADTPARVVNVSSYGHQFAPAEGISFETLKSPKKPAWFPLFSLTERYRYYGEVILVICLPYFDLTFFAEQTCEFTCKRSFARSPTPLKGNILFSNELNRRHSGKICSIAVHPGWVNSNLARHHGAIIKWVNVCAIPCIYWLFVTCSLPRKWQVSRLRTAPSTVCMQPPRQKR